MTNATNASRVHNACDSFDQAAKIHNLAKAAKIFCSYLTKGEAIDAKIIRTVMSRELGGSDSEGFWVWKDAYDAVECGFVLFIKRFTPTMMQQKPSPRVLQMLAGVQSLCMTQTRRSEESQALQQFSTPSTLGFCAYRAAQITSTDVLLEPSAGTGMLGVFGHMDAAGVIFNEWSPQRAGLLSHMFPDVHVTSYNAEQIDDYLDRSAVPSVALQNPPFSVSPKIKSTFANATPKHIVSTLDRLAEGGRLVTITGSSFAPENAKWHGAFDRIRQSAHVSFSVGISGKVFAAHGTTIDTRLTVLDKAPAPGAAEQDAYHGMVDTAEELLALVEERVPPRCEIPGDITLSALPANPPKFKSPTLANPTTAQRKGRVPAITPSSANDFSPLEYSICDWKPSEGISDSLYEPYEAQSIVIPNAQSHPSDLVQSAAMASVAGPKPSYQPLLPTKVVEGGALSHPQLESVIYAGEAHSGYITGHFTVDETMSIVSPADPDDEGAVQFRRGWFLGDGTGVGKGNQVAGIILDNKLQGRRRAVWISMGDKLINDAKRDWEALGGDPSDIFDLGKFKQGASIPPIQGILFTTYATLRTAARGGKISRVEQIVDWVGEDFDGVIAFDEAHAMANASSCKGERGDKKASLQGLAGLRLQHSLPDARVVYVSATGATEVRNLAYAQRLGLWGTGDFPFKTRDDFVTKMEAGGVAAMEVICRDLKALGLYTARSMSYDGVEYETIVHELTPEQIEIYDAYAVAFLQIHNHLDAALEATNICSGSETFNRNAKSAARSAFESNKQRFFNHLITAMKVPTIMEHMEKDLEDGHAVILQLVSTSESLMKRRLDQIPQSEWEDLSIDLTPRENVCDYLEHSFPTRLHEITEIEKDQLVSIPALDEDGNAVFSAEAERLRDEMMEKICSLPPVQSALDQFVHTIGHDNFAEITGRSLRIIKENGRLCVRKRPASANLTEAESFMNDEKRVLGFTQAGCVGRSYHAEIGRRNTRLRVHYLVEFGWIADRAIQGFGRSHRADELQPPKYKAFSTNVKGEKRFVSTIARRLDTLGAMTKGQRQTGGQGMLRAEDNLENEYANAALRCFFQDLFYGKIDACTLDQFEAMTGLRLTNKDDGSLNDKLPPIRQFLNRMLALTIDTQNTLFAEFEERINARIEEAVKAGTFDVGVETIIANAITVDNRQTIYQHPKTGGLTEACEIVTKTPPGFVSAGNISRHVDKHTAFLQNAKSGRVALRDRSFSLTHDDGTVEKQFALIGVTRNERLSQSEYNKSYWEAIGSAKFYTLWQAEVDALPEFEEHRFHLITGLLLPIWDKLPEFTNVNRLQTDNGNRMLGCAISTAELSNVLFKMDVDNEMSVCPIETTTSIMERGSVYVLDNGWEIRRKLCMGEHRLVVCGPTNIDLPYLKSIGCRTEIVSWQTMVFIPTNDNQSSVVSTILEKHLVTSLRSQN
ncbi:MAG: methylase [Gammaproteobacteria bacterium]|nr:methylase [Gammaproteobacteria bacterium]